MRYLQRLAEGVDVLPLMHAIYRQPQLWGAHAARTLFSGTPHGAVDDIWLRYNDDEGRTADETAQAAGSDAELVWYEGYYRLPEAKPIISDLMRRVGAYAVDRLLITRLKPGAVILDHSDNVGEYVGHSDRARYHVVLQGNGGNLFRNGDDVADMKTGEVWAFNALEIHGCKNVGTDDRIHLIVDVRLWP